MFEISCNSRIKTEYVKFLHRAGDTVKGNFRLSHWGQALE